MIDNMNLLGYLMDKNGYYADPVRIKNVEQFNDFLYNNIERHYELRITNSSDEIAFQVVNKILVFPLQKHGAKENKWNAGLKQFIDIFKA